MDDKLILNILKTIKKEQLKIIDILEDNYVIKANFIDYEDGLSCVDDVTKELVKQIEKKANYFTKVVNSEDEMLKLFDKFFSEINPILNQLIKQYKLYKTTSKTTDDNIFAKNISLLIIDAILNDYINFLVKLEGAILGLDSKNVILNIDAKEHIELIEVYQENSSHSIFTSVLLSLGAGYLIGNM